MRTSGPLNEPIQFIDKVEVPDGEGGTTASWATQATIYWAKHLPMSGKETVVAGQLQGRSMHRFYLRYISGVSLEQRVLFNSETYEIVHKAELPHQDELQLLCELRRG